MHTVPKLGSSKHPAGRATQPRFLPLACFSSRLVVPPHPTPFGRKRRGEIDSSSAHTAESSRGEAKKQSLQTTTPKKAKVVEEETNDDDNDDEEEAVGKEFKEGIQTSESYPDSYIDDVGNHTTVTSWLTCAKCSRYTPDTCDTPPPPSSSCRPTGARSTS